MQIYENGGYNRRKPKCSYCRQEGHRARECPNAPLDWEWWRNKQVPHGTPTPKTATWYAQPRYWGEWYTKCVETMNKRIEWQEKQSQPKAKRKAVVRNCGFCGEHGHTRRTCTKMQSFLADCLSANAKWRAMAYDKLVNELGIYVGSAIKVKRTTGWGASAVDHEGMALVTDVNFDKINVMCALRGYSDFRQGLTVTISYEGRNQNLSFDDLSVLEPAFRVVDGWGGTKYVSKISNSSTPLDPSWVTEYKEAFEWLVKKRSYEKLREEGIVSLIEAWK